MMSRTMGTFFANLMPYVALVWALGFMAYVELLVNAPD